MQELPEYFQLFSRMNSVFDIIFVQCFMMQILSSDVILTILTTNSGPSGSHCVQLFSKLKLSSLKIR